MARTKGSKNKKEVSVKKLEAAIELVTEVGLLAPTPPVVPIPIAPLSVDYPSEGLNDMARKINEIISRL